MNMRALLGACAVVASLCVVQPVQAGFDRDHHHRHLRQDVDRVLAGVASVISCPIEWFRDRLRHREAAYAPAPKKVAYAKKAAAKKMAQAKPLK